MSQNEEIILSDHQAQGSILLYCHVPGTCTVELAHGNTIECNLGPSHLRSKMSTDNKMLFDFLFNWTMEQCTLPV